MKVSIRQKIWIIFLLVCAALVPDAGLLAWTEHSLISHPVLSSMGEVRDAPAVQVEDIDAFLAAEEKGIEKLLAEDETWAKSSLQWYAPLPGALAFKATGNADDVRARFCNAIRVNTRFSFPLYLHLLPGAGSGGRPPLAPGDITVLKDTADLKDSILVRVSVGEMVKPLDVIVTATDDPDLELDIGLFEDNETDYGKIYGFGSQPFGNPHLEYGSKAPFHMGFYHESPIIYKFAGFLKKTYPEYRIHLFKKLAEFAFQTGHPYWGWRFTGWGLHYLADLAQPYHATVLPGVSTMRALWINTADILGFHSLKTDALQLVSNRHLALEKYLQIVLQRAYRAKEWDNPILAALRSADPPGLPYEDTIPRGVVAILAHDRAVETDKMLMEDMPRKFVFDPRFEFGTSAEQGQIVDLVEAEKGRAAGQRIILLGRELLAPFAVYGASYVRAILKDAK